MRRGLIGLAIDALELPPRKWLALALMAGLAPLGAWSVAGMETGLVLGLAAAAVSARVLEREGWALGAAGVVAALRPEALPWAIALALAPPKAPRAWGRWCALGIAVAPFAGVCAIRLIAFGRVAPLSLYAKPSDLSHGARYALACAILTGVLALVAWRGLPPWVRGLQAAVAVHFLAIAVAGGDWMPLSRLAVVALPTLIVAAAYIVGHAPWSWGLPRIGVAFAIALNPLMMVGPKAAAVGPKRMAVIAELGPALREARVIGALDVGWVGAASDATIVDFAGVTDPAVAALAGGHTSKRIGRPLLDARNVDTLVLQLQGELAEPWTDTLFARWVEMQVAHLPSMKEDFVPNRRERAGPAWGAAIRGAAPPQR